MMKKKYLILGDKITINNITYVVTHITKTNSGYPFDNLYWFNGKDNPNVFLSDGFYITELEGYVNN